MGARVYFSVLCSQIYYHSLSPSVFFAVSRRTHSSSVVIETAAASWDGGRRVKSESGGASGSSAMDTGVYARPVVLLPGAGQE